VLQVRHVARKVKATTGQVAKVAHKQEGLVGTTDLPVNAVCSRITAQPEG
jgi:hypothetical protein